MKLLILILVLTQSAMAGISVSKAEFRRLAKEAAEGDQNAIEQISHLKTKLYAGIDYQNDSKRVIKNLEIMRVPFDLLAEEIGKGNDNAFKSLVYATEFDEIRGFTADAFAKAATEGHEGSLAVLLNHDDYGILLSTTVGACENFEREMPMEIIEFLFNIHDKHPGLSAMSAHALFNAANKGNREAKAALKKAAAGGEKYAKDYYGKL